MGCLSLFNLGIWGGSFATLHCSSSPFVFNSPSQLVGQGLKMHAISMLVDYPSVLSGRSKNGLVTLDKMLSCVRI